MSNSSSISRNFPGLEGIPDTGEIKYSEEKGFYSDSNKPGGSFQGLKAAISFVARILPGGSASEFKKANNELASKIGSLYKGNAEEIFRSQFSSRISLGRPISIKKFRMIEKAFEEKPKQDALKLKEKISQIDLELERLQTPGLHLGYRSSLLKKALVPFFAYKKQNTAVFTDSGKRSLVGKLIDITQDLQKKDLGKRVKELISQKVKLENPTLSNDEITKKVNEGFTTWLKEKGIEDQKITKEVDAAATATRKPVNSHDEKEYQADVDHLTNQLIDLEDQEHGDQVAIEKAKEFIHQELLKSDPPSNKKLTLQEYNINQKRKIEDQKRKVEEIFNNWCERTAKKDDTNLLESVSLETDWDHDLYVKPDDINLSESVSKETDWEHKLYAGLDKLWEDLNKESTLKTRPSQTNLNPEKKNLKRGLKINQIDQELERLQSPRSLLGYRSWLLSKAVTPFFWHKGQNTETLTSSDSKNTLLGKSINIAIDLKDKTVQQRVEKLILQKVKLQNPTLSDDEVTEKVSEGFEAWRGERAKLLLEKKMDPEDRKNFPGATTVQSAHENNSQEDSEIDSDTESETDSDTDDLVTPRDTSFEPESELGIWSSIGSARDSEEDATH